MPGTKIKSQPGSDKSVASYRLGHVGQMSPKILGPKKTKKWFMMVDVEWGNCWLSLAYPTIGPLSQILRLPWTHLGCSCEVTDHSSRMILDGSQPRCWAFWSSGLVGQRSPKRPRPPEVMDWNPTKDWEYTGNYQIDCLDIVYIDWLLYVVICCYMSLYVVICCYCCYWSD
jgi:hypothetical protein